MTPTARFWSKVDMTGGLFACWPWVAAHDPDGYGLASGLGDGQPTRRAHRKAYELAVGPVPDGLNVLHDCDNPPCCNPLHLMPGTGAENMRQMVERGRSLKGDRNPNVLHPETRPRGSRNGWSKLTEEAVAQIKRRLLDGEPTQALAADFGVTNGAIWFIAKGRNWTHVQPAKAGAA